MRKKIHIMNRADKIQQHVRAMNQQNFAGRTYDGQEIDLLELNNKQHLQALECKWQNQKVKVPTAFAKAYPEADFAAIHQDNYLEWVVG